MVNKQDKKRQIGYFEEGTRCGNCLHSLHLKHGFYCKKLDLNKVSAAGWCPHWTYDPYDKILQNIGVNEVKREKKS